MRLLGHLLVPGYAQIRHGRTGAALAIAAAFFLLLLAGAATPWLHSFVGLATFLAVLLLGLVAAALDGRRRRAAQPVRPPPWAWALLGGPVWVMVAVFAVPSLRDGLVGLHAYRIPTDHEASAPVLRPGDRFLVEKVPGVEVARGDLVVFDPVEDPGRTYVKRVVALEGDVVWADAEGVHVNRGLAAAGAADPLARRTVPPGHAFVVGDNLPRSRDSRHFGPIEVSSIRGRALYVIWSKTWRRIGTKLR